MSIEYREIIEVNCKYLDTSIVRCKNLCHTSCLHAI